MEKSNDSVYLQMSDLNINFNFMPYNKNPIHINYNKENKIHLFIFIEFDKSVSIYKDNLLIKKLDCKDKLL